MSGANVKRLLVIEPNAVAFMLVMSMVAGIYQPLHADTLYAADYTLMSGWPDVVVVDPLIAPMDSATALVNDVAASGKPAIVWTAIMSAAIPGCPLEIIAKDNTLRLAAWLEEHR